MRNYFHAFDLMPETKRLSSKHKDFESSVCIVPGRFLRKVLIPEVTVLDSMFSEISRNVYVISYIITYIIMELFRKNFIGYQKKRLFRYFLSF